MDSMTLEQRGAMTDEAREEHLERQARERARLRRIGQYARRLNCERYEAEERLIEDLWGVMGGEEL